jgi:hypothetical protein
MAGAPATLNKLTRSDVDNCAHRATNKTASDSSSMTPREKCHMILSASDEAPAKELQRVTREAVSTAVQD